MQRLPIPDFRRNFESKAVLFLIVLVCFLSNGAVIARSKVFVISDRKVHENERDETRSLSEKQIELLEMDLREKTGLESLRFAQNNELVYDFFEKSELGSEKLRQAIKGAIDDEANIFIIGDYSNSKNIHFAATDEGTIDVDADITIYNMMFDFADFTSAKKYSDAEALASFTPAIVFFHEIDHKVSYDENEPFPIFGVRPEISSGEFLGAIENANLVRSELGLIERDTKRISAKSFRKKIYEIPFVDRFNKYKFLRWKISSRY